MMLRVNAVSRTRVPRRFRFRFWLMRTARWLVPAPRCLTLPLAVTRNRFLVPLCVFILGIAESIPTTSVLVLASKHGIVAFAPSSHKGSRGRFQHLILPRLPARRGPVSQAWSPEIGRPDRSGRYHRTKKALAVRSLRGLECSSDPYGNRTHVAAVKGRCPRPLDEGADHLVSISIRHRADGQGYR
jgi:hypothetical protein